MATFVNRNGRITAQIVIKPLPRRSRTFGSMEEAQIWASETEEMLRAARLSGHSYLATAKTGIMPSTRSEVTRLPRLSALNAAIGIYFLFDGSDCVYVGQSCQIHTRVQEHRTRAKHLKAFDSYSWVACSLAELNSLERYYIELLKPKLNTVGSPNFAAIQMVGAARRKGKVLQLAVATKLVRQTFRHANKLASQ